MIRKSWIIKEDDINKLRSFLLEKHGKEDLIDNDPNIKWRIRINNNIFILYKNNKFYIDIKDNSLLEDIEYIIGKRFKDYNLNTEIILGFDEVGKGEVLGAMVLCDIAIEKNRLKEIDNIIGSANTKERREFGYWKSIATSLSQLIKAQELKNIQPIFIDKYNVNELLDVYYMRMIRKLYDKFNDRTITIIIDDYNSGKLLKDYVSSLKAEVIIEQKADDNYLAVKVASVIAKRARANAMEKLREEYGNLGSGNLNDNATIKWLEEFKNNEYPWFVKQSYIQNKPKERFPVSNRFSFENGLVNIKDFYIFCSSCGNNIRSIKLGTIHKCYDMRCIHCNKIIKDANIEMLYYIGSIILDANIIIHSIISNDLNSTRLFEGFTFLIYKKVEDECNSQGGKAALERIANYKSIGMINLEHIEDSIYKNTDDTLIDLALKYNAILMTKDKPLYNKAQTQNIFCIV